MHPFHRVTHPIPPTKSPSKQNKDWKNSVEYSEREDDSDERCLRDKSMKTSPDRRKELLDARYAECLQASASVTPTEWQPNRINNILKAKEMVLWSNNYPEWDSNAERLGSNKNNIIKESLNSGK